MKEPISRYGQVDLIPMPDYKTWYFEISNHPAWRGFWREGWFPYEIALKRATEKAAELDATAERWARRIIPPTGWVTVNDTAWKHREFEVAVNDRSGGNPFVKVFIGEHTVWLASGWTLQDGFRLAEQEVRVLAAKAAEQAATLERWAKRIIAPVGWLFTKDPCPSWQHPRVDVRVDQEKERVMTVRVLGMYDCSFGDHQMAFETAEREAARLEKCKAAVEATTQARQQREAEAATDYVPRQVLGAAERYAIECAKLAASCDVFKAFKRPEAAPPWNALHPATGIRLLWRQCPGRQTFKLHAADRSEVDAFVVIVDSLQRKGKFYWQLFPLYLPAGFLNSETSGYADTVRQAQSDIHALLGVEWRQAGAKVPAPAEVKAANEPWNVVEPATDTKYVWDNTEGPEKLQLRESRAGSSTIAAVTPSDQFEDMFFWELWYWNHPTNPVRAHGYTESIELAQTLVHAALGLRWRAEYAIQRGFRTPKAA